MNYYSTNKIRKSLGNTTKNPKYIKQIYEFYSDSNIFNSLGVEKLYLPKGTDEIHISQDDFEKINLFASLKLERGFKVKRVGMANPEIYKEMEEFKVESIGDVRKAISRKMKEVGGFRLEYKMSLAKTSLKKKLVNEIPVDIEDKRIMSIDFEFSNKKDLITEMGLTIKQGDNIMSTHYLIDTAYETKSDSSLQKRFRFGQTEIITLDQMIDIVKSQLDLADYALFHDHKEDLRLFAIHGIWINDYPQLNILDTQVIYGKQKPLQELLTEYEIDYTKKEMHNSGNDAYYTVKLLEKILNNSKQNQEIIEEVKIKSKIKLNKI
jgi:hypothetical protein